MSLNAVLIITEVFSPEEFLINDIANQWIADGKKVSVLTRNPAYPFGKIYSGYKNKFFSTSVENGITIHRYHIIGNYRDSKLRKMVNYIWNTILASSLALLFMRKSSNIFIYHTGPLTVALPGVLLKKFANSKVVIWTQDIWPDVAFAYGLKRNRFTVWAIEKFVSFIYHNCHHVIATSRPVQRDLQARISRPTGFVPNWPMKVFQNDDFATTIKSTGKFTFTFAGNIGVMQNLDVIIEAFHLWANNRNDVQFDIYGDGSAKPQLEEILIKKGIKNVCLKGRVPVEKIPAIYQSSDVLVIPLRHDSVMDKYVPAKFSTYLTTGKPIMGIISGAIKEYINDHHLGFVAEPQDTTDMIKGFEFFTRLTPDEKMAIQDRARALYALEFDATLNYQRLSSLVFDSSTGM